MLSLILWSWCDSGLDTDYSDIEMEDIQQEQENPELIPKDSAHQNWNEFELDEDNNNNWRESFDEIEDEMLENPYEDWMIDEPMQFEEDKTLDQ